MKNEVIRCEDKREREMENRERGEEGREKRTEVLMSDRARRGGDR
jgi:hypothetical protein